MKTTNEMRVWEKKKRGHDYKMCDFVLVSDFVGQGVGERTHWPIPVSQTHSVISGSLPVTKHLL